MKILAWTMSIFFLALTVASEAVTPERTFARYTDTAVVTGNTFTTGTWCDDEAMYVWDIQLDTKKKSGDYQVRVSVYVRRDSDADCTAESGDDKVKDASVTVQIRDSEQNVIDTSSGTTNGSGRYKGDWITVGPTGTYGAFVTGLTHSTYTWDDSMDQDNPAYVTIVDDDDEDDEDDDDD